ncbi:hypothetical protein [Arthrobacter sp. FW306-07-I]|nr:hypothetical protein [Arthrobacter sp. FW306-07-I]UKA77633.1 hypothetical protein LFT46_20905 [Arthrobacter sp. FW306-07-I]
MATDYILTEDDLPGDDASLAEDIMELSLLTADESGVPVDIAWAQEHHNF